MSRKRPQRVEPNALREGFERRIEFCPAYDLRDPDPSKDCGIHGVEMTFYLSGPKGVVQFKVFTSWMLPHVEKELEARADRPRWLDRPMPADLGYHSPTPRYESQPEFECDLLRGGKCYYDGSGLNAEPVFEKLLTGGDGAVWNELDYYYKELFEEGVQA